MRLGKELSVGVIEEPTVAPPLQESDADGHGAGTSQTPGGVRGATPRSSSAPGDEILVPSA